MEWGRDFIWLSVFQKWVWNVSKTVSVNWQCLLERQKKSFRYQRWHSGASMKHLIKLITHGTLRPHRLWFHIYAYVLNWMQFIKVTYWIRTKFLNQFRSKFLSSKLKFYDVHCLEFHMNFLGCMQFDWKFLLLITNSSSPIHSKWSISLSLKSSTTYTWNQFWFHYGSEVQYSNPHAFCDENEIKWQQNEFRKSTEVDTSMGFGTRITFPPENFNFIITLLAMESLCHDFSAKYYLVPWKQ